MKKKIYKVYENDEWLIKSTHEVQVGEEVDVADMLFVLAMIYAEKFTEHLKEEIDKNDFILKWVDNCQMALKYFKKDNIK